MTPFLLCHGYDPVNPIETNVKLDLEGAGTVHDRFTDLLQTQRNAHDLSRNTFKNIQTGMKARYDTHSHEVPLREGDRVWLFWPRIKDNFTKLKLAKVFHGPYVIVSFHTDSTVWLKHTVTGKFMTKPVTVHRLKRSIDRKTLEDKWPDYDIGYDDLEDLQVQDLPTDSFIPDVPDQHSDTESVASDATDMSVYSDSEVEDIASDGRIVDVERPMARKTKMGPF